MKVQPFFARFLETQPPNGFVTMKYPSDQEDNGSKATVAIATRYPSATVDLGSATKLPAGGMMTMRYPSDNEDGGFQTLKYPSDNEDGGSPCAPNCQDTSGICNPILDAVRKLFVNLQGVLQFFSTNSSAPTNAVTLKYPSDSDNGC